MLYQLSYSPIVDSVAARRIGPTWIRTRVLPVMSRRLWTAELWAQGAAYVTRNWSRGFISNAPGAVKVTPHASGVGATSSDLRRAP